MTQAKLPTPGDIALAIEKLIDMQRACELVSMAAGEVANASTGEINAKAEGIYGFANILHDQLRQVEIMIGGQK